MKAALLKKTSKELPLNELFSIEDIPDPEIASDNDVIVSIKNAALNHRDLWIARGMYSKISLPAVLGSDGSGIVYKKGNNVAELKEGDEVLINPNINWGDNDNFQSKDYQILGMPSQGTFAEFIKADKSRVHLKPEHLDHFHTSALPLAGLTAYRALFIKEKLKPGENVLITGIGGGVATMILLFAVSVGANVYVTSGSEEKIDGAKKLGAKDGVCYKNDNWDKDILQKTEKGIDLIIDSSGGDTLTRSIELLNYGGRIVLYGATLGMTKEISGNRIYWKQISIHGSTMGSDKEFTEMLNFVREKEIKPVIDSIFPLEKIYNAMERMSEANQFGKIVLEL